MRSMAAFASSNPTLAVSCRLMHVAPVPILCRKPQGLSLLQTRNELSRHSTGCGKILHTSHQVRRAGSRTAFRVSASSDEGQYDFDLFTIGAGTGGVRASRFAANYGAKVAICEMPFALIASETRGGPGGTCVLRGCIPKKMLAIGGEMREMMDAAVEFGWEQDTPPRLNWDRLRQNKNKELERLSQVYMKQIETAGIKYVEGRGHVVDAHTVEVNGEKFTAKNILLAVGTKSIVPPIEGTEHTITSDGILDLPECPKKLVVVGGGYIAAEQASIYKNFGVDVHMLYRSEALLAGFDKDCVEHITEQFKLRGIHLSASTSPVKIVKEENGQLTVTAELPSGEKITIDKVDQMLMATGRKPNTLGLGLEEAGVELGEQKEVVVNDINQSVSAPSVWALGDCSFRKPLTPVARMEGTTFAQHVFGGMKDVKPEYDCVASVVFSSPQLATVGLSEQEALEKHDNIDVFLSVFKPLQNTISKNEGRALMKLVVNADDDKLLGAHMVGPEAAEILMGMSAIVKHGLTKSQLDRTVGIHPTSAEEFVTMRDPARRFRNKKLQEDK